MFRVYIFDLNFLGRKFMNKTVLKLMLVLICVTTLVVSWKIVFWEVNSKMGFSEITFWIGIVFGILIGIVSTELKYAYKA